MEEAFANTALAMFNYMTPLSGIRVNRSCSRRALAQLHAKVHLIQFFASG